MVTGSVEYTERLPDQTESCHVTGAEYVCACVRVCLTVIIIYPFLSFI